jgi:hypothetical protein
MGDGSARGSDGLGNSVSCLVRRGSVCRSRRRPAAAASPTHPRITRSGLISHGACRGKRGGETDLFGRAIGLRRLPGRRHCATIWSPTARPLPVTVARSPKALYRPPTNAAKTEALQVFRPTPPAGLEPATHGLENNPGRPRPVCHLCKSTVIAAWMLACQDPQGGRAADPSSSAASVTLAPTPMEKRHDHSATKIRPPRARASASWSDRAFPAASSTDG